ncbi:pyruvate dehydrogenase X component [Coprinopsis sp. MPI-PUGE-AT-0042]|nr:pyruvate dehydrogenase X component [Coprinopsis sp. MPI-PUGE-AT-0042]
MASTFSRASSSLLRTTSTRYSRQLHQSSRRHAVTNFQMPAMSPTMTEGGIASWKKKEGESFAAGDVLLEIETDKATIDVEAQEDGIMGKILVGDGSKNVPIGKTIALLAEEGDDISNLEAPKDEPAPSASKESSPPPPSPSPSEPKAESSPPDTAAAHSGPLPSHSQPIFPSVHRLILENGIRDLSSIKGTGIRGMITKGDVLTYLGKASGPNGTYKPGPSPIQEATKSLQKKPAEQPAKPLDGDAVRRLIVNNMLQQSIKARNPVPDYSSADFDSILADYLPPAPKAPKASSTPAVESPKVKKDFLDGLY